MKHGVSPSLANFLPPSLPPSPQLTNVEHGFAGKFYSLIRVERSKVEELLSPNQFKNAPFHSTPVASSVAPESCGLVQFWEDLKMEPTHKKKQSKQNPEKVSR